MKSIIVILIAVISLSIHSIANNNTMDTLLELQKSRVILQDEIQSKTIQRESASSEDEKKHLQADINQLNKNANQLKNKFETIAIGVDISLLKSNKNLSTNTLSEDFHLLLKPLVESAKEATKDMRKKAELQEEIAYYKEILPQAAQAYENIENLLKKTKDKQLKRELSSLQKYWNQQITLLSSNLNASRHQVEMLEKNNISFSESVQQNTKNFFQERGFFLLEGFISFFVVILVMQLIYILFVKLFPILTKPNRSFYLRLFDLLYRLLVALLAIVVPMGVFYYEEDWVLFSFGLLVLFGIVWTFRHFISDLWRQARLLLNIGSVREGERIFYAGLPWQVKNINVFTIIENPVSGIRLRIPIEELIEKEGYKDGLKKLIVQFERAGDSSLDIAVMANFKGEMAPIHNRLRRAIGRWCVEACSEYGWEIPFPQLTVHQPK